MAKMVMNRNRTIATIYGHAIEFKKGIPSNVPDFLVAEFYKHGAELVEGDLPPELREDDATPKAKPLTAEERAAKLQDAIKVVLQSKERGDFTAGGQPHARALSRAVGFEVGVKERDEAWQKYLEAQQEA